jgi:hypothetical protein
VDLSGLDIVEERRAKTAATLRRPPSGPAAGGCEHQQVVGVPTLLTARCALGNDGEQDDLVDRSKCVTDADGNDVPPVRITPAKRPRTAAQERAAREKMAAKEVPDEEPKKVPVKRATRKLSASKSITQIAPVPADPTAPAEVPALVDASPAADQPVVEPAAVEAPVVEAPVVAAPAARVDAPIPPLLEPPTAQEPAVEPPTVKASKPVTPKVLTPKPVTPKVLAAKVVAPKPEAPEVEAPKLVVPAAVPPRAPSPLDNLPAPRPGVPITKTHVFGVAAVLVLLVGRCRRRRKKKR